MKKIIIIIAIFLFGNKLFAGVCDELFDGLNCNELIISETITLSEYPGCEIPITYKMIVCYDDNNNSKVFFELKNYTIPNSPECSDFKDDNSLPDGSPDWDFMIWFSYRVVEELTLANFLNAYNNALPSEKSDYECPHNGVITYSILLTHCKSYSFEPYVFGPNTPPLYKVTLNPCSGDICCEKIIEYCYNVQTDEIEVIQDAISYSSGDCGYPPPPQPNAIISPCYEHCFIPQK